MNAKKVLKFIFSISICLSAGIIGSLLSFDAINTWYVTLNKPWFVPSGQLISIIWTGIYILMGISLYIVLTKDLSKNNVRNGLVLFALQLIMNATWTYLFFGLQSLLLGFIGIIILWFLVFVTINKFYYISKKSAYILVPYIIWLTIALLINLSLYLVN